jgi:hypothetical protein
MPKPAWQSQIASLTLAELRSNSRTDVEALDGALLTEFAIAHEAALRRAKSNKIALLVEEFRASVCTDAAPFEYELAFLSSWSHSKLALYEPRLWINEYTAGVYFIYDQSEALQYVGSSCGGGLGNRLYAKWHHPHREFVDVVLFDRRWCRFALAFEALTVSRLKPPLNAEFKDLWIPPPDSYASHWVVGISNQKGMSSES